MSIEETFAVHSKFEQASGARLNRGKSKGMWLGTWKQPGYKSFESPLKFTDNGNNTIPLTNVNKTRCSPVLRSKLFQTPFKSPHKQDLHRPKVISPSS